MPVLARFALCLAFAAVAAAAVTTQSSAADSATTEQISATALQTARDVQAQRHLKAVIVEVRQNGQTIYTGALGESMSGVPATADMHFRNGSMGFTYMATLLLELVDQKKTTLDTKLSTYFPNLPHASEITLKNLANMTSGYADYVYQPEVLEGVQGGPFRQWTPEELIQAGVSKPLQFAPGTNWGYSHTNYVILGRVIEKIAGVPLAEAMQRFIFTPMGLTQTQGNNMTPVIPQPVLHTFTSERREFLGIKPGVPFYEESTYWNPSWTMIDGAVQTTNIDDFTTSMEAVGTGKLLSPGSSTAQVKPELLGFGHKQPGCDACRQNDTSLTYGIGVMLLGPWIAQVKSFFGSSATVGYLPSQKLTIAAEVTYGPEAFKADGNYDDMSVVTFTALANALAPKTLPPHQP